MLISIPSDVYVKLEERAKAKGLSVDEYVTRIILEKVRR